MDELEKTSDKETETERMHKTETRDRPMGSN